MPHTRVAVGALALALVGLSWTPLSGQRPDFPLAPGALRGDGVAPFFDGWYLNPDGSYSLSFGFMNRNTEEVAEIPIGEDNFIQPAEFNGAQPTHFPPVSYGGFNGRRERGVFVITVPAGFEDDVVWTLRHNGKTYSVPGRATFPAYELGYTPQAAGSLAPTLRFSASGPKASGRGGATADQITAEVGTPVPLTIWVEDEGEREGTFPVNMVWWKHQGPGSVTFEPSTGRTEEGGGELSTTATFDTPGEYVLRVQVNNFGASDSSFGNQCCWTNGYVPVTVVEGAGEAGR